MSPDDNKTTDAQMAAAKLKWEDAYERGGRDAIRDNTLREHTEHLLEINGSVMKTAQGLEAIQKQVAGIEEARKRETAVAEALATYLKAAQETEAEQQARGVTTKALVISVIAIVIPVIASIIIAIILSQAHP